MSRTFILGMALGGLVTGSSGCGGPRSSPIEAPAVEAKTSDPGDATAAPVAPELSVYPIGDGPIDCRGGVLRSKTLSRGSAGWCERDAVRHGPYLRRLQNGKIAEKAFYIEGRRHGPVVTYFKDGRPRIEGRYDRGSRVGPWRYANTAGERWGGPMRANRRTGEWTFEGTKGVVRQRGSYVDGARHGRWQFRTADGESGVGTYANGLLEGCEGVCQMLRPAAEIQEAVAALRTASRACYSAGQAQRPELAGEVVLEWTIGSDGAGGGARVKATDLRHIGVEGCLVSLMNAMTLPSPPDGLPYATGRRFKFSPKHSLTDRMSTNGHCRAADLRQTLNPSRSALSECLGRLGHGQKTLKLSWALAADGRLGGRVKVSPDSAQLQACVDELSKGWVFVGLGGTCHVRYELSLGAGD